MSNTNLKERIKLYKHYNKLINNTEDKRGLFNKEKVLGEGNQGKVYQYCRKNKCSNNGIAVKKMYLDWKEGKFVEDMYNPKALKYGIFIELASNQLINELVLQEISPNFILHYTNEFEERWGICAETYPYKSYFYNEFINNSETYTDWVTKEHSIHLWYNAFFQITSAIYALQKYFNMTHLDLHSDNILVRKVKKGGYWTYIINGKQYKVPNLGYQFYISDFGHAWIPNNFKSWFISQKYKKKQIHQGFDMYQLFKSTMSFTTSPSKFRKDVRHVIKKLRKNDSFEDIIEEIWGERYVYDSSSGQEKTMTSKKLETFDMDKKLKTKNVPQELRHLVIH
jgi:serine/threonine protein kinase